MGSRKPQRHASAKKTPGQAGHRQRLRERFMQDGLGGFHDYEVIELLLTLASPRKDCKPAAKEALARFKSLPGVLEASTAELCTVTGIGPRNALGLKLIKAVADRFLEKRLHQRQVINSSQELFAYLTHTMRDLAHECFKCVFLDAKNRMIAVDTLFTGTLTASSVYPREVIRAALDHRAAAMIFAHNHPSGDPMPSPADDAVTRQLVFAGRIMGVTVHDHLIIGDGHYYSFADQGRIAAYHEHFDQHQQEQID